MLTDKEISNFAGESKPYRKTDGEGLYLEVKPDGKKYWRWAYRFAGKQKTLAVGVYPKVSAKSARKKRDDAKALLEQNIDPSQHKKVAKLTAHLSAANTFEAIAREWRIPAERIPGQGKGMKMKEEHIVPLNEQAVAVLEQLRPLTGAYKFLFPCIGRPGEAGMSENTLRLAVQKGLGFPVTAHGFRATATSALLELGWPAHVIDKQLAHRERRGATFGAYSHQAEYLPERRKMMQAWGNYLQALQSGSKVKAIRAA